MSTDYYLKTLHGMHGMVMLLGRILALFTPYYYMHAFQGNGANLSLTHSAPNNQSAYVRHRHEACISVCIRPHGSRLIRGM